MWKNLQKRVNLILVPLTTGVKLKMLHLIVWLFSDAARPIRFICIGSVAGVIQLVLLDLLTYWGWSSIVANSVAFLLAAQVNFLFSSLFTWRDRQSPTGLWGGLLKRWVAFHGSIAGTAVLNELVFIVASREVPTLLASVLGIALAAIVNFLIINRFVFRQRREESPEEAPYEEKVRQRNDEFIPTSID